MTKKVRDTLRSITVMKNQDYGDVAEDLVSYIHHPPITSIIVQDKNDE
jgi:hypothetical protein